MIEKIKNISSFLYIIIISIISIYIIFFNNSLSFFFTLYIMIFVLELFLSIKVIYYMIKNKKNILSILQWIISIVIINIVVIIPYLMIIEKIDLIEKLFLIVTSWIWLNILWLFIRIIFFNKIQKH